MARLFANSGDPDQMPHFRCLQATIGFEQLYLQNFWMEVVHPCPDVRYWSENVCCTIQTYMSDLEVKVINLEKNYVLQKFLLNLLEVYIL